MMQNIYPRLTQTFKQSLKVLLSKRSLSTTNNANPQFIITPQLNLDHYAKNSAAIASNLALRNYDTEPIHRVEKLYKQRTALGLQAEQLRIDRNAIQQKIRESSASDREHYVQEAKEHKEQLRKVETQLAAIDNELLEQALQIPNETHADAPRGPEINARVIKTIGKPLQQTTFPLEDHVSIAQRLDLIDFEQASLVSGSKFYYLKGNAAWLEWALIQYAMQKAASRGFEPVLTPDVVRTSIAYGCGFQPRKKEASQIYDVSTPSSNTQMCLIGTAEIPLAGLMAKKMFKEDTLPKRVVGFSHAFRAEAGHGSAEERGLYRVHQFSKVELFTVTTPEQSEAMLEELRDLQEDMFRELGLCFRVLDMPTEELGASAYRKYDIEAWMPGKNGWGEISSTSNCTDYQSRRLDIRYLSKEFKEQVGPKDIRVPWHIKEKWVDYCHTLNGTAMAVPRVIIALLETHQRPDGTIHVPSPLRKWIPGEPSVFQ